MKRSIFLPLLASATVLPVSAAVVDTVTDLGLAGATVDGTVGGGEYAGTVSGGGSGFGGPIGGGTLSLDSDANGVFIGLSNLGDFSGNSIRMYLDTKSGGFTELSDGAGFNDFADFGRERLSRPASGGLTLPFAADYGWILSDAFGGFQALFELQTGGNNSLVSNGANVVASAVGSGPTNATIELYVPYADLGMAAGDNLDLVLVYSNNNDQDNAFMSDEGFPFQVVGGNPGASATLTDFHRLETIPEPSVSLLGAFAGLFLLRRRR